MIEEQGRVVSAEGNSVWVETLRASTCSSCNARQGCGQHLVEKYKPASAFAYIRATSDGSLSEGDRVIVGIPENSLMRASVVVYLLPLLLLMGTLWFSGVMGLGDGSTLLLSVASLMLGFIPARKLGRQEGGMCRVKVVRVLSRQDSSAEPISMRST